LLEYFLHPCKKYSDSFALQNMSKIGCNSPSVARRFTALSHYIAKVLKKSNFKNC
jgi:hypothetical protein